ncbi:MAG: permease, partial [Planctomycetota bacterium]
MNQSISMILEGGLVRICQGFAAAAPTLMVGLFIAAILRYYLGDAGTRRLFGGESLRSLPQSWLVGMLLPVCSIGVLPILRQMHRAGVKPGAMSAFALSAPLFNPLSLLYGLTLSRPLVIILFMLGSLAIVTVLGLLWDQIAGRKSPSNDAPDSSGTNVKESDSDAPMDSASPSSSDPSISAGDGAADRLIGLRRLVATFVDFSRELTGVSLGLTTVALLGLALLAGTLPYGAMQHSVERDDWMAPLTMTSVAVPVYATPMLAMSQLGMMFQHANSPGAAFVLLILGTGMNFATLAWFGKNYGFKATFVWLASLLVVVLAISYGINRPLVPPGVEPAGHTHAFDIYANPISVHHQTTVSALVEMVTKDLDISVLIPLAVLGVMALIGIAMRLMRIDEAWLVRGASAKSFASSVGKVDADNKRGIDLIVPPGVVGATMLLGLIALSIVACFAYYPSPDECLDEISLARAECLSGANSGHIEHALYWLPVWEDWSRRLEVGTFIRTGQIRPYQRMQGYLIRKKLELLEHELEHDP